jgi:hypothetical protein
VITSLDDLVAFTRSLGDALPELRDRIVLHRPGCSSEAIIVLAETLPGIPESYLSIVRSLRLDGIAIGYFQLSPSAFCGRDLTEKLISCNDPDQNPLVEIHWKNGVYQVASWEADPIAVAHTNSSFKVGQVVKYNIAKSKFAKTFSPGRTSIKDAI